MPRIAAATVLTPWGDADATLAALAAARPGSRALTAGFAEQALAMARACCGDQPPDLVLLATTKGDCPRWCDDLLAAGRGEGGPAACARALGDALGAPAFAVSAACASGPAALGVAARWLAAGLARRVLVVGADRIGDFVRDGFAALKAVSATACAPFDAERDGLALGETAAALLLVAEDGAPGDRLRGWGARMDANHLTGPSRDGRGLREACAQALARADVGIPALIVAHGTGTRYNDDSESLAYAALAPGAPVTGFKGLLGHSLGACGVTEAALAVVARRSGRIPGVVGLRRAGTAGAIRALPPGAVLCANAGFGGIDAAVVIDDKPAAPMPAVAARIALRVELRPHGWTRSDAGGIHDEAWREPGAGGALPKLSAREVLGRVDVSWGRMDEPCRALVTLAHLAGPLPEDAAVVLLTERGCAASDRAFETGRRAGACDPQRFAYTLPSTAIGEASIRCGLRGAGLALLGADDAQGEAVARGLLADGAPAVLLARVEADRPPHVAWAQVWTRG